MSKYIVEIIRFKLKDGADVDAFANSADEITAWAKKQPGFEYRTLSVDEDGLWFDINYWACIEDNKTANNKFMADNEHTDFMKMIDPVSVTMGCSSVKLMNSVKSMNEG